jgi:hypothetical protein
MAARRILLFDANHLTAFRWHADGVAEEHRFIAGEAGYAAFQDYLRRHHDSLFYLLADVAEESFQLDDLPYVQGKDRRELIRRKLSQLFYGTSLALAIPLGRAQEGRRDERFLFAGLTGQSQISNWLQALRQTQTQLVGVFSLPQVIAGLAGKLDRASKRMLVITLGSAGLRQTFLENGQLRFSRLAPMAIGRIEEVARACAAETNKIYQYLAGQRLISRDAPLKTLVLAHPDHFAAFSTHCDETPERQVELVDLISVGRKSGLKLKPPDSNGDTLFSFLLVQQQPRQQFAPAQDRHYYRLWQARFGMRTTAAAILVGGMIFAGLQVTKYQDLMAANSAARSDVEINQRRYDAMLQGLPTIPISMDELRALTDRETTLLKRSPGPEPLFHRISQALGKVPSVELSRLHWHLANHPDEDAPSGARSPTPARAVSNGSSGAAGSFAIVDLQAQLPITMAIDHRSQLETVDGFVSALSSRDIQVKVVSLPFETESGKSIRSGEAAAEKAPPKFVLRIAQRL